MATNLMQANHQWSTRPEDERFVSLTDLRDHTKRAMMNSAGKVLATRAIHASPIEGDSRALAVVGPNGMPVVPTHWAFGQLAQRAGATASYLRGLPGPLAADCINYGLASRDVEDIGILLRRDGGITTLNAVTGPGYGRVWNHTIADALVTRFGDGVHGHFKVPGEFGKAVDVTKANTTLYASDRDMFVFLADEERRIEVPDRRDGKPGSLARGFFVWNSEVGAQTFGIATFLFDYVCCNRIVWGAKEYKEIRIRHTSSAPHRWIEEVAPAVEKFAEGSVKSLTEGIVAAKAKRLDDVEKFLSQRFTTGQVRGILAAHMADENRPIESLWDASVGVTAYARAIPYQDERVKLEREGGKILDLAF